MLSGMKLFGKSLEQLSTSMLISATELPGPGWTTLGDQTWRMGAVRSLGEISTRARQSGAFAALRRYRQEDPGRGLFVQLSPFASESDVTQALLMLGSTDGPKWSGIERLDKQDIPGVDVLGLDHINAWEHRNKRGDLMGYQRFIQGNVAGIAILVSGSMRDPGWSWEDLATISGTQASKVRECLAYWDGGHHDA
jgi:hypothetical protein